MAMDLCLHLNGEPISLKDVDNLLEFLGAYRRCLNDKQDTDPPPSSDPNPGQPVGPLPPSPPTKLYRGVMEALTALDGKGTATEVYNKMREMGYKFTAHDPRNAVGTFLGQGKFVKCGKTEAGHNIWAPADSANGDTPASEGKDTDTP